MKPLIVILGPTSSGKTKLAVKLASKFKGEIVSADSRQVYRGLDIGSGKDLKEYFFKGRPIPYHLIDVADPKKQFTLADYQKLAYKAIDKIQAKGKLPFLVGGTGLYLKAITDGLKLPPSKPGLRYRQKLQALPLKKLQQLLQKIDPKVLKKIDPENPRRLIRALEYCQKTGRKYSQATFSKQPRYRTLQLGLTYPIAKIRARIKKRLHARVKEGLIEEVKNLHGQGLSWQRLADFGLEYRLVSQYLRGKLTRAEMLQKLAVANGQLAKRQMTWFKRDQRIHWLKDQRQAEKLIRNFLKN